MIKRLHLSVLLLCVIPAWSQQELTLDQAVSLALKNNRLVKVSQLEVRKSENAVAATRTYRLPQFKFNMFEAQLLSRVDFTFPPGVFGVFPGIGPFPPVASSVTTARRPATIIVGQVNQPLSQLYRIGLGIRLQDLGRQIAQEKYSLQEQAVVNDVKKAYYNLLQTESALQATDEALKAFRELERVATNALTQQVILKSDVLDTQAGAAKIEAQAVTLRNTSGTLKERMNNLLGRDLATDFTVRPVAEVMNWELDLAGSRARALEQRPELREARLKVEQAEGDRRMKKAEYIPDVSLGFYYLSPFNIEFLPKNVAAVGVLVSWDVFDWGRKKHELESKVRTVEQAKNGVDETASMIMIEVGMHFRKLEEARQQLRAADLAREAAQEKVRVAVNRVEQDAALVKDALQMRASLAEATYKYQETLLSFWTARADLEKAIGEK